MDPKNIWKDILADNEKLEAVFSVAFRWRVARMIRQAIAFPVASLFLLPLLAIPGATPFVYGLVVLLMLISLAQIIYYAFVAHIASRYAITNKRVIIMKGLSTRRIYSVDFSQITDVSVMETFIERNILMTGSIVIRTAGQIDRTIMRRRKHLQGILLDHVERPQEILKLIEKLKSAR